ncbi:hypothetical protein HPB50_010521 [Hyalomma asiaticum]|uniref:Uncharacterized protein n=1 Tax=Hyalomma asiaticum TaxID=266040 RepID=A0ACB7SXC3_HYAAI|nr:hypothetical protein HPB50_010521 [Hyalomma asiaticum]
MCDKVDGQMRVGGKWNLLKHLLKPTGTRAAQRSAIEILVHRALTLRSKDSIMTDLARIHLPQDTTSKSELLVYRPIRMGRRPQGWVPTAEIDMHLFTKNGAEIPRKGTIRVLGMLISENGRNAATIHKVKEHTAATVRLIQMI